MSRTAFSIVTYTEGQGCSDEAHYVLWTHGIRCSLKPPTTLQIRNCLFLVTWVVNTFDPSISNLSSYFSALSFLKNITLKIFIYIFTYFAMSYLNLASVALKHVGS